MTDEFEALGAVFTSANTMIHKWSFINGTKGRAVYVEITMRRAGITRVERNTHSAELEIIA